MTDDDMKRLAAALTAKARRMPYEPGSESSLEDLVLMIVVDTLLVADGSLTIEEFEA